MKPVLLTLFAALALQLAACNNPGGCDPQPAPAPVLPELTGNRVLLLKVDYETNAFEGGQELVFETITPTFTVETEYVSPGDFGSIALRYTELDTTLFAGGVVWAGCGAITYPQQWQPANQFVELPQGPPVTPVAGFENVFNPGNQPTDYAPVWAAVQGRAIVRQYLVANPAATVKMLRYTPSVGVGNPADWDWIVILKN